MMAWVVAGAVGADALEPPPTSSTVDPSRLGTSYNLDDGIDPTLLPPPTSLVPATAPTTPSVWARLKAGWDAATQGTYDVARASFEAVVRADTTGTTQRVKDFLAKLRESRTNIDAATALVGKLPASEQAAARKRLAGFQVAHDTFGAGLFADAPEQPASLDASQVKIGFAPAVAAVIVVGIGGAAWAWAKFADLVAHTNQTALYREELRARTGLAADNRVLPPSTLGEFKPPGAGPLVDASGDGGSVLPIALVGAAILGAGWLFLR